jgi:hypothetical protein
MNIYRVQRRTGHLGDSGIEVTWVKTKNEARDIIKGCRKFEVTAEEFALSSADETYVLPKNLDDIVYCVEDTKEASAHFSAMNWVVEEVTIPSNKRDMLIFLNHIAYSW